MQSRPSTRARRLVGGVLRGGLIAAAVIAGLSVSAQGAPERASDLLGSVSLPDVELPDLARRDMADSPRLWRWSGASAGMVRTVTIDIDASIYPADGVRWFLNGKFGRTDIHGPLDVELGKWHNTPQRLRLGDVVQACWTTAAGEELCPEIVIR